MEPKVKLMVNASGYWSSEVEHWDPSEALEIMESLSKVCAMKNREVGKDG